MMSSAPCFFSSAMIAGTSVLWPAASVRDAHRVHVVLDRLARAFLGRLEQRAHVDVEAQVGEGRGHHLGAAVVPVLAQLGDHHARTAALLLGEGGDLGLQFFPAFGRVIGSCIHTGHLLRIGAMAPEDFLQRIAIPRPPWRAARTAWMLRSSRLPWPFSAAAVSASSAACTLALSRCGADLLQPRDLLLAHHHVVDFADLDARLPWPAGTC